MVHFLFGTVQSHRWTHRKRTQLRTKKKKTVWDCLQNSNQTVIWCDYSEKTVWSWIDPTIQSKPKLSCILSCRWHFSEDASWQTLKDRAVVLENCHMFWRFWPTNNKRKQMMGVTQNIFNYFYNYLVIYWEHLCVVLCVLWLLSAGLVKLCLFFPSLYFWTINDRVFWGTFAVLHTPQRTFICFLGFFNYMQWENKSNQMK